MKFKSKSLISIILSIMMVMSMILVAIPANAAVIVSVPVGADTYYLWYGSTDNPSSMTSVKMSASGNAYTVSIPSGNNKYDWTYFFISKGSQQSDHCWPDSTSTLDKSALNSMSAQTQFRTNTYDMYMIQLNAVINYLISYDGDKTVTVSEAGSTPTTPQKYNITKAETSSGTFDVNKSTAAENDTVTITASPAGGYEVENVTYTYNGTTVDATEQSDGTYTFTMPAYDVTVNVTFKESATPTAQYYIGGRFKVKDSGGTEHLTYDPTGNNNVWNASCTDINFKFIEDSSNSGWYYLNTNLTVAELSAQLSGKNDKGAPLSADPYFLIHTGNGDGGAWYGSISDNAMHSLQNTNALPSESNLTSRTTQNKEIQLIKFSGTQSTIAGNVTLHFNPTELKLYYTTDSTSTPGDFKIVDKTAANGKLTFSAPDKAAGTASADDEVTVTATPDKYFECTTIVVTYKDSKKVSHNIDATKTAANTFTFTVPSGLTTADIKDQEITVKGTFTLTSSGKLDYVKDKNDGLYIDVAPLQNDSTSTLIKWNNYYGKDHNITTNPYTFYVPKNVDLSQAQIYNGFNNEVKLNGVSIPAQGKATVSLKAGQTYNSGNDNNTHTVKVMQGSTNAMFLTTSTALPTQYNPDVKGTPTEEDKTAKEYKEQVNYKGGSCKTMTNTGAEASFSPAMGLSSIKGRGNSSWKASAMNFGKYAFNMKLSSATNLFNMDTTEPTGSKSWCLLANNADESMLRNALTYQLADEIGLLYSPEFSFVDIYDNGEYMGSYLVTEKVDVGSSKLVKGISYDDINEDYAKESGLTGVEETTSKGTYNNNSTNNMQYAKVTADGDTTNVPYDNTVADAKLKGKYLLEFEITERYQDEASWFTSPRGQHVVVKSPEYATKEQVTYIAQKFAAMEDKVFKNASKSELSTVMDVESFAKMYLIQEFSSNLDAASTSYYLTFDCSQANPVFVANPVWDYDWAYGQYNNSVGKKVDVDGKQLDTTGTNSWVAKNKAMDDSKNKDKGRSLQSQLAGTNVAFKSVIRKQWEGTNGFHTKIQKYIGDNGQIKKTWFENINASAEMNETRWGFIASDPIGGWGSKNTGANHTEAVNNLNKWVNDRATWLNTQFTNASEYAPYTPSKPTIAAYNSDLTSTISQVDYGASFVIKVTSAIESNVTYRLYEGSSTEYLENSDGVFNVNATEAGIKSYTVKAVYGSTESEASSAVSVTVIAPADLEGVSLSVSNTSVNVNEEFTLTAKAAPVGVTGVKYTFYKDNVAIASDITSNTYTTKLTVEGTADYKVKATANGKSFESSVVTVTAAKVAQVHNFRVYFKCASAPAYKPYVSLDGAKAVEMTQGTELGKNYAGTLTFFWYYADFSNVDSADTHTLTFTSKRTKLNATITDNFANSEYYLAVDNLMTGTEVVDLTGSLVYVRNFFHSATNLVYSGVGTDGTLGFTNIDGEMYKMGTVVNTDGTLTFSVKSATTMQMLTAELTTVSETQQAILDVNLDGKVDIKDATLMQMALVS